MPNLLEYLTLPNLEVNRSRLRSGSNTIPVSNYDIEGVRPWLDLTYDAILGCAGDILLREIPAERFEHPNVLPFLCIPTDEACVDYLLKQHNHAIVNCALNIAQPWLQNRRMQVPIAMSLGSQAVVNEDPRLRPDWAIFAPTDEEPPWDGLAFGDTKQSVKWRSDMRHATRPSVLEEFSKPIRQILLYCNRVGTRYGFIITDKELLAIRRTKAPDSSEALSLNRTRRITASMSASTHNRVISMASVVSGTSTMSMDTSGSPYTDAGNPDIDELPLEIVAVPWENHGPGKLTVNLLLFFLTLLAACGNSVEESYPTLGHWHEERDSAGRLLYRQEGSQKVVQRLPSGAIKVQAE